MQGIHLRKYGVEAKIPFVLYEVDGVDLRVDAADGGTDCALTKDEGAETTCTNDFVDEGSGYSITLTATEMQAARISVYIIDSATKVWLDEVLIIETYGHASAQHAFDLDTGDGSNLTEAGGTGDHLTAINLPNQTMDIVGNITGNLSGSVGSLTGHTNQTADHTASIADIPTVAEFEARTIASADYVVVGDTLARVTLVDTVTTNTDLNSAQAEPGQGSPAVNATPLQKLAYLFKSWRNKKDNDGTTRQLYNDAGAVVDQKSGVAEAAGTVTTNEWESGP